MGYLTFYGLEWGMLDGSPVPPDVARRIGDYIEAEDWPLDREGNGQDQAKWYDCNKDVAAMSLEFPGVVFTLSGEGEESPDMWRAYFLEGGVQEERAKITYPPFDPKKLVGRKRPKRPKPAPSAKLPTPTGVTVENPLYRRTMFNAACDACGRNSEDYWVAQIDEARHALEADGWVIVRDIGGDETYCCQECASRARTNPTTRPCGCVESVVDGKVYVVRCAKHAEQLYGEDNPEKDVPLYTPEYGCPCCSAEIADVEPPDGSQAEFADASEGTYYWNEYTEHTCPRCGCVFRYEWTGWSRGQDEPIEDWELMDEQVTAPCTGYPLAKNPRAARCGWCKRPSKGLKTIYGARWKEHRVCPRCFSRYVK